MSITIHPLGGFGEIGRNSIAIEIEDEIVILDMGMHLERYIDWTEDGFTQKKHALRSLMQAQAIPDIRSLRLKRKNVKAILCSHAHLDHIAGIPFLYSKFSCPIYTTEFTAKIIESLCAERNVYPNIITKSPSSRFKISSNIEIEFIHIAHSTPGTVAIVVHTKYGAIVYANDYKNDTHPPLESPTDWNQFAKLKGSVKLLILDSLYAPDNAYCPSENEAHIEVLSLEKQLQNIRTIIASSFSSHISRLKSFCDLADSLHRTPVFIGRSLSRYIDAAKQTNIVDLEKRGILLRYARDVRSFLHTLKDPENYLLITTGTQGEPLAALSRMANELYNFNTQDVVIFSSRVIPSPITIKNRNILENTLKKKGVKIIKDVHVSGHASAKDHKEFIELIGPEYVAPAHAEEHMIKAMNTLLKDCNYDKEHILLLDVGTKKTVF